MDVERSWDELKRELLHVSERGSEIHKDSRRIRGLNDKVSKLVLYDDLLGQRDGLVHYTAWKSAMNMFDPDQESPVIRMYNYEQANDPEEGQIRPPEWKALEKEERKNWLDGFLTDDDCCREDMEFGSAYGCSFSSGLSGSVEDDLTYWRLYGNDGQGCSLKISTVHGMGVYMVRYRDRNFEGRCKSEKEEDEKVAKRLRSLFKDGKNAVGRIPSGKYRDFVGRTVAKVLLQILYGYYHLVKHLAYEDEREWRMIRVMPRPDEIRYDTASENLVRRYIDGPALNKLLISESIITIGPTVLSRGAARAYLEHAKEKHNIRYVKVKDSGQTYQIYRQGPRLKPTQV